MNYVYMSTCMKALCRHVKQNKQQTDTISSCRNMLLSFTRSAQLVICCETSPKTKSKTAQTATGSYRQAGRNAAHVLCKDLQSHGEGVSIEVHFVSPSQLSGLMEED